jgi:DNA-binding NtrC family response regulator
MPSKETVLLVEDTQMLAITYQEYLKREPFDLIMASTGQAALDAIISHEPNLILLDLKLPDMDGQDILHWLKKNRPNMAVIVMTAHSSVDIAVDVMRLGAKDFLEKPFDAARLQTTVRNMLERERLKYIVRQFEVFERQRFHGFVGSSLAMQAVYHVVEAAAPSSATVFITGESGTGKEVCAQAIHSQGPRKNKPFVAINCGAIPKELMESELFGHIKGAFTGAISDRQGAASQAHGGTLFLDEICEMDAELQTKLLRFIQTSSFQRVGSGKLEKVDIRIICATNRDPQTEVAERRFREDLYYRLHVVPIHLPPLRQRDEDIIEIAEHFLKVYAAEEGKSFRAFSLEVLASFMTYDWPGNIRQLQNVIRNILVLQQGTVVEQEHLPPPLDHVGDISESLKRLELRAIDVEFLPVSQASTLLSSGDSSFYQKSASLKDIKPLAEIERNVIENAIALCGGNIPKAARYLDVSPSTIYRKKQSWSASMDDSE